jgi:hypothetical protein
MDFAQDSFHDNFSWCQEVGASQHGSVVVQEKWCQNAYALLASNDMTMNSILQGDVGLAMNVRK